MEIWALWVVENAGTGVQVHKWLGRFDPDANQGRGFVWFTDDVTKAQRFSTFTAVMDEWKRPSTIRPLREDGRPNRPLTAFTVIPKRLPS